MYIAAVHMCKEVYMRQMCDIGTGCDKLSVRLIDWCLARISAISWHCWMFKPQMVFLNGQMFGSIIVVLEG
jgi:hypothetical protein